ncbi:MAG: hypothetical protein DRN66_03705 [Candidatus Nanohalarchaeota archaeon]|nr:MAG: hypothetical protein DRN66_03705 [Candidatus Nanohaloarchaeota archaeon]
MKILGICSSPREKSNTHLALPISMEEAKKEIEGTEIILLGKKTINQCVEGNCSVNNDAEEIFQIWN